MGSSYMNQVSRGIDGYIEQRSAPLIKGVKDQNDLLLKRIK